MNPRHTATYIKNIATAVPEHKFDQKAAAEVLLQVYGDRFPEIHRYLSSFNNTLIKNRYSAVPLDWFYEDHGWQERSEAYKSSALSLANQSVDQVLENSFLKARDVDAIIAVSTTGIMTPTIDAHLLDYLDFRSEVLRIPVFGWGCAGGLLGLILAHELLQSHCMNNVLLFCVELCTLSFSKEALSAKDIISNSLFSDGAAAVIISSEKPNGLKITNFLKHRWPDSISVMGWDMNDSGMNVIFSQKIPEIVKQEYPKVLDKFFTNNERKLQDYAQFLAHPGGPRIIEYLEKIYDLPHGAMQETRDVLTEYGNMSSPTVLFVLDQFMKSKKRGKGLVSTLGPGFTSAILEVENL